MRSALKEWPLKDASHAGHALSRLLTQKRKGHEEAQKEALQSVTAFRVPEGYAAALARWQEATADAVNLTATTRGPLAIGLGNASPYEVGLTLHHTYGVPYLPGSALKGLARRAALQQGLTEGDEAFRVLFGDMGSAGYVTFWDGWMDAGAQRALQLDTITVHHPTYYQSGKEWPTDFDDPTPVAFLSVRPGVKFHLRLSGPGEWPSLAARLVAYGLDSLGLGGKTNAGYGGLEVEREKSEAEVAAEQRRNDEEERQKREAQEAKAHEGKAREHRARIDTMNMGNAKSVVDNLLNQTADLPKMLRCELLAHLLNKLEADSRTKGDKKMLGRVRQAQEEAGC